MSRYKYYINGILQDLIPQKPSSSTSVKLDDTAVVGTKDTVDKQLRLEIDDKVWDADKVLSKHETL